MEKHTTCVQIRLPCSFTVQFHPSATRDYKASLLLVLESPGPWDAALLPPDVLPLQASMDSTGLPM